MRGSRALQAGLASLALLAACADNAGVPMPSVIRCEPLSRTEWESAAPAIQAFSLGTDADSAPRGSGIPLRLRGWIDDPALVRALVASVDLAAFSDGLLSADPMPYLAVKLPDGLRCVHLANITETRPGTLVFSDGNIPLPPAFRATLAKAYDLPTYSVFDGW